MQTQETAVKTAEGIRMEKTKTEEGQITMKRNVRIRDVILRVGQRLCIVSRNAGGRCLRHSTICIEDTLADALVARGWAISGGVAR